MSRFHIVAIAAALFLPHCTDLRANDSKTPVQTRILKLKAETAQEQAKLKETIETLRKELLVLRKKVADQDRPLFYNRPGTGIVENPGWAANRKEVAKLQEAVDLAEHRLKEAMKSDLRYKEALKYLLKVEKDAEPAKDDENSAKAADIDRGYRDYLVGVMDKELKIADQVEKQLKPAVKPKSRAKQR
jgi:hypothetical protein